MSEQDTDRIVITTERIASEIIRCRILAHEKHGQNSIEAINGTDVRWLSILVEEVGELAHELTYDANTTMGGMLEGVRREARDVAVVAVALIASIDDTLASEPFQPDFGKDD